MAEGRLPDFVIIGAMKAGTTTLHGVLRLHLQIFMARDKELDFFPETRNLHRGTAWYRRQFRSDRPLCGEASPSYAAWPRHAGVPERMRELIPEARIVYCVRDPVERAISHYKHMLAVGHDMPPVDEGILREPFLRMGRYSTQLGRYLDAGFAPERIHVVQSERLRTHRAETMTSLLRFLGADPEAPFAVPRRDWHLSDRKRVPTRRGRQIKRAAAPILERMPARTRAAVEGVILRPVSTSMPKLAIQARTRERLREALAPEADGLRARTGQPFEGWQV